MRRTFRLVIFQFLFLSINDPSKQIAGGDIDFDNRERLDSIYYQENGASTLEAGKSLEREIAEGEVHVYRMTMAEGDILQLTVDQPKPNLSARITDPEGKSFAIGHELASRTGLVELALIALASGAYQWEFRLAGKTPGRYALRLNEKKAATAKESLSVSKWLTQEAARFRGARRFDDAIAAEEYAVRILERQQGPDHADVAAALEGVASTYRQKGDNQRAAQRLRRAVEIREKGSTPWDLSTAFSLNALAVTYMSLGDYAKAEPLYDRALKIRTTVQGPEHLNVADVLNNFATNYKFKGDYANAETFYRRALEIRKQKLKPDDNLIAQSLNNLAVLYMDKGDYPQAEAAYKEALRIRQSGPDPEGRATAIALSNLAAVYQEMGDYERAEPLYDRVLLIYQKLNESENLELARTLNNRATMTLLKRDLASAEPMYRRALEIREKILGPHHPDVTKSLDSFAVYYALIGDLSRAIEMRTRSLEIRERNLTSVIATGSGEQKQAYLSQPALADEMNIAITLHARSAPKDPKAARMALNLILQRKGRALDAMVDSVGVLRRSLDPKGRELLDQLSELNSRLASLTLNHRGEIGASREQNEIAALEGRRQGLESAISAQSVAFKSKLQAVTIDEIQRLIPSDAVLVEFAMYQPFDPVAKIRAERYGPPRYLAYVLRSKGEPLFVELGDSSKIDDLVKEFRRSIRDPKRRDALTIARKLDEMTMRPVRTLFDVADSPRRLLISPDGLLNLLPFCALVDEQRQYLINRFSISYLSNGRDLLRLQLHSPSRSSPLIVADPAFGLLAEPSIAPGQGGDIAAQRPDSEGFTTLHLASLPYTAKEGKEIQALLPGSRLAVREEATKILVSQVEAPGVLHIATHGFFFPGESPLLRGEGLSGLRDARWAAKIKQPLLRSGLAFAGFNQHREQGDNGVLTALEAAGLDLWGTKLVVLSACDTGIGDVRSGEGVYGLRRALVLAGAETQIMSLWSVSDYFTRKFMTSYYAELMHGVGRGDAVRHVQLQMLKMNPREHPRNWAGFIQSGEWGNLDGKR